MACGGITKVALKVKVTLQAAKAIGDVAFTLLLNGLHDGSHVVKPTRVRGHADVFENIH